MRFPLVLRAMSFICLTTTIALAVSFSKPDCPEKCGNVTIPYPFGIGAECSANSSFAIVCQNSSTPFLSSINMEAVNISLNDAIIVVKHPVLPLACSDELKTQSLGMSLPGSPFTISSLFNSLTVLGCQNAIWLRANETTTIGGCMSICDRNATDTICNGVNCCQVKIPQGLQELQFTYRSIVSSNNVSCGYAFLAEDKWFREDYRAYKGLRNDLLNPFDKEFGYASMALEWQLNNRNISLNAYCWSRRYPSDFETTGYRYEEGGCSCEPGYEGNPYLREGCQDINECNNSALNTCPKGITCVNEMGYYSCKYPRDRSYQVKIAFICIGGALGAILLLIGAWRSSRVVIKRIKANRKRKFFKRNGGLLLEQQLSSDKNGVNKTKLFSSKELAKATDHYNENRVLGRGGQGTVYKGMLTDGRIVAVKKSKRVDEGDLDVFINEVVILSQINHRSIVKLLGCCLETEVPLLVYEFIPNGTLFEHIHDPNEDFPLTWDMRVRIVTEVAGALSYLHSSASAPIYHRDIKSTNILLDEKYRAKIADFGTSRSIAIDQTHLTTRVLGTFGYLDPEYFQSSQFTDKSDVYSFGVLMVELLTGERAISSIRAEVGRSLATHFLYSMEENNLFEILDARVLKEGRQEEILAIAELSRRCLNLNSKKRPTMKKVVTELEGVQLSKEGSNCQPKDDEKEQHSIEIPESYDFASTSEITHGLDTFVTCSSDVDPLLLDES